MYSVAVLDLPKTPITYRLNWISIVEKQALRAYCPNSYAVTLVLIFTILYKLNLRTIFNFLKADMGLEDEQIKVLKNCFDGFADEDGAIPADNIGNILEMMGLKGSNT